MSTYLTKGIVLRRADQGEYDRQFFIYTEKLGKILAIAKGAKKISSKLNPHLNFFTVCELMLAPSQNGFYRLAGAVAQRRQGKLSPECFIYVYNALEAADRLTLANHADWEIFRLLDGFLADLAISESSNNLLILNKFLYNLLLHSGYAPKLAAKSQRQLCRQFNAIIEKATEMPMRSLASLNL